MMTCRRIFISSIIRCSVKNFFLSLSLVLSSFIPRILEGGCRPRIAIILDPISVHNSVANDKTRRCTRKEKKIIIGLTGISEGRKKAKKNIYKYIFLRP